MINIISIVGAILALLAYISVVSGRFKPTGVPYNSINLLSCFVLGSVAVYTATAGYILLNIVWGLIATYHLIKSFFPTKGVTT